MASDNTPHGADDGSSAWASYEAALWWDRVQSIRVQQRSARRVGNRTMILRYTISLHETTIAALQWDIQAIQRETPEEMARANASRHNTNGGD